MIDINTQKMMYDLYLNESKLYENIIPSLVMVTSFSEFADIRGITESMETQITDYITKVNSNIQSSWDRFKQQVGGETHTSYLKQNADTIARMSPDFPVSNFPTYNFGILTSSDVIPFDYERMKEDLKSVADFNKKYYNNILLKSNSDTTSISVALKDAIVQRFNDTHCDAKMLNNCYAFCTNEFYAIRRSIERDLKTINTSTNNIVNMISTVLSTNESASNHGPKKCKYCGSTNIKIYFRGEPVYICGDCSKYLGVVPFTIKESYEIIQEIKAPVNPVTHQSMSFKDTNPNNRNPINKPEKKNDSKSFPKCVTNYMKASTELLSAKMEALSTMYNTNFEVIKFAVSKSDKSEEAGQSANRNVENRSFNSQVNI